MTGQDNTIEQGQVVDEPFQIAGFDENLTSNYTNYINRNVENNYNKYQ